MNLRKMPLRAAITPLLKSKSYLVLLFLCAVSLHAAGAAPGLVPGETFSIRFPDLPPTFYRLDTEEKIPTQMTVFLPTNYESNRKHPLLIFLEGGNGGGATNPKAARALSEEKDFVCVILPLFKEKLLPKQPPGNGSNIPRILMRPEEATYMWPIFKKMLAGLDEVVPNLDPEHQIIGGFSNGAHTIAAMIDDANCDLSQRFSGFFLVEGGMRIQRFEALKGKPILMVWGHERLRAKGQTNCDAALAVGARATLYIMNNVGHDFPVREYPAVRAWLRGELWVPPVAAATTAAKQEKESDQTKTGTVKKVDVEAKQLVVMAARGLTFTITDSTKIQQQGKPLKLSDVKLEANVSVDYVKDGDKRTARKIVILKDTPAGGESMQIQADAQLQSATTHPMQYYLSLPKNWSANRAWPVLVAPNAHYGDKGKHIAFFAAERDARKADFIIVAPLVINADRVSDMTEYRGAVADAISAADAASPSGRRDETARGKFDSDGIMAILKDVQKLHHGEDKVYITGFSSSTHVAYMMLFTHPELLKGVIINSGVYLGRGVDEAHIPLMNSPERVNLPIKYIVGEEDRGYEKYSENWQEARAKLLGYGHPASKMQMEVIKPGNSEHLSAGHYWFPTRIFDFCAAAELALQK